MSNMLERFSKYKKQILVVGGVATVALCLASNPTHESTTFEGGALTYPVPTPAMNSKLKVLASCEPSEITSWNGLTVLPPHIGLTVEANHIETRSSRMEIVIRNLVRGSTIVVVDLPSNSIVSYLRDYEGFITGIQGVKEEKSSQWISPNTSYSVQIRKINELPEFNKNIVAEKNIKTPKCP